MTTFTYRNKTDRELLIVGAGRVAPNETIESAIVLENANLELVKSPESSSIVGTEQPQSEVITNAQPIESTEIENNEQGDQQ